MHYERKLAILKTEVHSIALIDSLHDVGKMIS